MGKIDLLGTKKQINYPHKTKAKAFFYNIILLAKLSKLVFAHFFENKEVHYKPDNCIDNANWNFIAQKFV